MRSFRLPWKNRGRRACLPGGRKSGRGPCDALYSGKPQSDFGSEADGSHDPSHCRDPRKNPFFAAFHQILDFLQGKQALAIGPGISTNEDTATLVKELLINARCPIVLDADAITAVSEDPAILRKAQVPLVLTPHPGEMARICHCTVSDVQRDRLESASRFSREYGVVLVLKGHRTVIAAPDGKLAINSTGNPAMASGGMGDTLTGIIAGLLAQGFDAFQAACLGVYVHGAACDRIFGEVSSRGLLATDMLDQVPAVLGLLEAARP